jgi:TorA maturation chaperone TorD
MEAAPIKLAHGLEPEDEARAQFYALLARLYSSGPDAALLAAIGGSEPWPEVQENAIAAAWNRLILASRAMDPNAAEQEYTDVFVGVGKSPVNLHGSHWLTGFMMERPLAQLRADLGKLGLARRPGSNLLEDQLGAVCETMRILVAGDGERRPAPVAEQRAWFEGHIAPWVFDCCDAICKCPLANYYRRVAELTRLFMAIERDSLAIG